MYVESLRASAGCPVASICTASTAAFTGEARAFDPELGTEELMQALRNVWILNSIQMLLDREVSYTPAIFGYSMLYPETDIPLDDPELPMADKRRLNGRLGRRLAGERLGAEGEAERRIWELLGRIETGEATDEERLTFRALTALSKLTTGKQAVLVASEGVEAFGGNGYIARTTDGGATWTRQDGDQWSRFYGVDVASTQEAWAVGYFGRILHTEDGGTSWTRFDRRVRVADSMLTWASCRMGRMRWLPGV